MAVKLLKQNTNGTKQEYPGLIASLGVGSAGEFPVGDAAGKLDSSWMPVGFGVDAVTATAGEALAAGDMVYFDSAGEVFKADATAIGKAARGYVNASVSMGASATVYFDDSNTGKTGLTAGATYYLSSASPGAIVTTPPTTATHIVQEIGFATSATNLRVNIQEPIIRS